MKSIKTTVLVAALVAALATPAAAAELEKVWEKDGFALPESVFWDGQAKVLYVSNIAGTSPSEKDGNGYISKLSADGKVLAEKWVTGLDAPKGMAAHKGKLYVSDIDRLVVVDLASARIQRSFSAPGAKFLNDVTVDEKGVVYVSDMMDNAIWRLEGTKFVKWLEDPQLEAPNGLKAERERLVVAAWGPLSGQGFASTKPGMVKAVSYTDRLVRDLGPGFGNLDGLEPDGKGGYVVSDWLNGGVFSVSRQGKALPLVKLPQGSADIGIIPEQKLLLVPMMMDGKVAAYKLP